MAGKGSEVVNKKMLDEAVQTILTGMDSLFEGHNKRFESVDESFAKIDGRLDKIESDVYFMRQDIKDIKVTLSDTPTREEFDDLKVKVSTVSS